MKQLPEKLEKPVLATPIESMAKGLDMAFSTINKLIDYLEDGENKTAPPNYALEDEPRETITLPKPQWWEKLGCGDYHEPYLEALSDASKASGITFKFEE